MARVKTSIAILATVMVLCGSAAAAARRPHVLFIATDDLNLSLGCYGKAMMKTPNST